MSCERKYFALTVFVLIMATIQIPLFYYYTSGLVASFLILHYEIIGLGLTFFLFTRPKKLLNTYKRVLLISVSLGISSLIGGEYFMEYLDWNIRKSTRNRIIEMIKRNELIPNVSYNENLCHLKQWTFPPISNDGNEISIQKNFDRTLTVEFYINRGFLDHYSAFVYTDDSSQVNDFEKFMFNNRSKPTVKKLDKNWYRVSY